MDVPTILCCGYCCATYISVKSGAPAKPITFSQYYRTRAEECCARANAYRDTTARAQMLKLANEYELKAKQAKEKERSTTEKKELQ